jgi:hypothetical protein
MRRRTRVRFPPPPPRGLRRFRGAPSQNDEPPRTVRSGAVRHLMRCQAAHEVSGGLADGPQERWAPALPAASPHGPLVRPGSAGPRRREALPVPARRERLPGHRLRGRRPAGPCPSRRRCVGGRRRSAVPASHTCPGSDLLTRCCPTLLTTAPRPSASAHAIGDEARCDVGAQRRVRRRDRCWFPGLGVRTANRLRGTPGSEHGIVESANTPPTNLGVFPEVPDSFHRNPGSGRTCSSATWGPVRRPGPACVYGC